MKLGTAFSDALIIEKKVGTRFSFRRDAWWTGAGRALLFATVFFVSFFVLVFRLFSLTVIDGHRYRVLADENRTREVVRTAPRGILFDRTGKALVSNTKNADSGYVRTYVYPEATAHIVGYIGELSSKELADPYYANRNYHLGDRIGRMGTEAIYEDRLRGRDGRELMEIDTSGNIVRLLGRDIERAGEDITLSVDSDIAKAAKEAFPAGAKGAVVVSIPKTGEILALYSSPDFSLNDFSLGLSSAQYARLTQDPHQPMFNRAIGGTYPPGSIFKLVTSIAGLETGAIDKDTVIEDTGVITIGPFSFPNWYFLQYGKKEGPMDLVHALKRSNDIYFYKAGEQIGITKLAQWARRVGIGKPLGIELPGEASGLMPDPMWKNLNFVSQEDRNARNNLWYTGDTYHVAIGQGYLLTTPLQVNAWTNIIANGGKLCKPTLLKTREPMTRTQQCKDLGIKKETIELITEGMREACDTGGTGWPLFNFTVSKLDQPARNASQSDAGGLDKLDQLGTNENATTGGQKRTHVPVACKTGTAEFGDPQNRTHAWFTVFGPLPAGDAAQDLALQGSPVIRGEPEISITVLVEEAGEGSDVAAPVAKKILEAWFQR